MQAQDGERHLSVPLPLDAESYASVAKSAGLMVFVEAYKTKAHPIYLGEDTVRLEYLLELLATGAKVDVSTAVDMALRGARVSVDQKAGVLTIFQSFPFALTKGGTLEQSIAVPEFRGKFKDLNALLRVKGVDRVGPAHFQMNEHGETCTSRVDRDYAQWHRGSVTLFRLSGRWPSPLLANERSFCHDTVVSRS